MFFKDFLFESFLLEASFIEGGIKYNKRTRKNGTISYTIRTGTNYTEKHDSNQTEYDKALLKHLAHSENDTEYKPGELTPEKIEILINRKCNDLKDDIKKIIPTLFGDEISNVLLSQQDKNEQKPGIFCERIDKGNDYKNRITICVEENDNQYRKDCLSKLLGPDGLNILGKYGNENGVKDTTVPFSLLKLEIQMKPTKSGGNTKISAGDYLLESSIEKVLKEKNIDEKTIRSEDGSIYFSKDNLSVFKDIILDSVNSNPNLKNKKDRIKKILNAKPEDIVGENGEITDGLYISFGEIIIPYLLLARNSSNKEHINKICNMLPDEEIIGVKFPTAQNNQVYDYQIISQKRKKEANPSNVTHDEEKAEKFTHDVSAKFDDGHKISLSSIIKNKYKKYYDSVTEQERKQIYTNFDESILVKFANIQEKNLKNKIPDYVSLVETALLLIDDFKGDKNVFMKSFLKCVKFDKSKLAVMGIDSKDLDDNDIDINKYKDSFCNYIEKKLDLDTRGKNALKDNYPNSITYYLCKLIQTKIETEEHETSKKVLKNLIGNIPYYQVRIKKNKKLQCEVIDINQYDDWDFKFELACTSNDITCSYGNIGYVIVPKK